MNIYLLLVSLISNITVELNQEEKQIFTSYRPQRFELNETSSEELKAPDSPKAIIIFKLSF